MQPAKPDKPSDPGQPERAQDAEPEALAKLRALRIDRERQAELNKRQDSECELKEAPTQVRIGREVALGLAPGEVSPDPEPPHIDQHLDPEEHREEPIHVNPTWPPRLHVRAQAEGYRIHDDRESGQPFPNEVPEHAYRQVVRRLRVPFGREGATNNTHRPRRQVAEEQPLLFELLRVNGGVAGGHPQNAAPAHQPRTRRRAPCQYLRDAFGHRRHFFDNLGQWLEWRGFAVG
mmetsp:Transcript_5822/g.16853  ORF Transcript_5822/g.16853 Transcript_5822/m.16853 type:complete len:233 (-) Transcript_5822:343-1041(-)